MRRSIWISINRTEKSNRIIIARDAHPINSASTSATERQPLEWRFFSTTSYMCTGVATAILRLSYGIRDSPKLVHPIYAIYSLHIHTYTHVYVRTLDLALRVTDPLSRLYTPRVAYIISRVRWFGKKCTRRYTKRLLKYEISGRNCRRNIRRATKKRLRNSCTSDNKMYTYTRVTPRRYIHQAIFTTPTRMCAFS